MPRIDKIAAMEPEAARSDEDGYPQFITDWDNYLSTLDLSTQKDRLATLQHWPSSKYHKTDLVKLGETGFYYYGISNSIKCFYCKMKLKTFESITNVDRDHRVFFKDCPTFSGVTPIINISSEATETTAVYSSYKKKSSRLESFEMCSDIDNSLASSLADAGFFTASHGKILCFQCGVALLRHVFDYFMDDNDDVWEMHVHLNESCSHVTRNIDGIELTRIKQKLQEFEVNEILKISCKHRDNNPVMKVLLPCGHNINMCDGCSESLKICPKKYCRDIIDNMFPILTNPTNLFDPKQGVSTPTSDAADDLDHIKEFSASFSDKADEFVTKRGMSTSLSDTANKANFIKDFGTIEEFVFTKDLSIPYPDATDRLVLVQSVSEPSSNKARRSVTSGALFTLLNDGAYKTALKSNLITRIDELVSTKALSTSYPEATGILVPIQSVSEPSFDASAVEFVTVEDLQTSLSEAIVDSTSRFVPIADDGKPKSDADTSMLFPPIPLLLTGAEYNEIYASKILTIKYPAFRTDISRVESFQKCTISMKQTPQALAEAGFYYVVDSNETRCYYCGGGLKGWQNDDEPWEKHAIFFPKCHYLITMKGDDYINRVKQANKSLDEAASFSSTLGEISRELEIKQLANDRICTICLNAERSMCFNPCGHVAACSKCALSVQTCPICRQPYTSTHKIFFS